MSGSSSGVRIASIRVFSSSNDDWVFIWVRWLRVRTTGIHVPSSWKFANRVSGCVNGLRMMTGSSWICLFFSRRCAFGVLWLCEWIENDDRILVWTASKTPSLHSLSGLASSSPPAMTGSSSWPHSQESPFFPQRYPIRRSGCVNGVRMMAGLDDRVLI